MNEKTTRILLVEDNLGDVRLLQEYLKESDSLNADLIHVDCLSEAVACLGEAASYDLVLLDLSLPDSQGLATFSAIQERAGNLPIILLTGNDDESLAVQAVQQGAQDYLVKGKVDADLLARAIRYGIERNRLLVEMEKVREVEQHLAYHDMLTNLPNRLLFYDRMRQALAHARRYSGLVAVLFLDLDGFKAINDRHGHAVGDRLLQAVATRLKGNMRQSDTIARLGGDEFTILLTGIKSMKDVSRTAQKVLSVVSRPFAIDGHQLGVTCSIGVSVFPHDGSDTESLIKRADFAMYRAKNQGKGNYQHFDITVVSQAPKQASFENDLRKAIVNHELRIHFQPQVSLATGQITGVEALVRWQHPEFGLLPPSEFIPLAEESGLIVPLGEWVLRSACIQNKVWQVAGYEPLPVAINLSARQFREIGLPETVSRVLHETGLSPNFLMLEITETNAM
ncbi:MAG: diguanylate cyclase, partial [Calditrichaeota bacterium]|nr:diguanylate cyclase [Calditrichota bacterium]